MYVVYDTKLCVYYMQPYAYIGPLPSCCSPENKTMTCSLHFIFLIVTFFASNIAKPNSDPYNGKLAYRNYKH